MHYFADSPLFMDAPVAYSVLDRRGRQVAANRKFYELFGYPETANITASNLTHEDDRVHTTAYLEELYAGERHEVTVQKRYLRVDGSSFWGRLTARSIDAPNGQPLLLGVIENIEAQKDLEEQLRDEVEQRSDFVARVSHELRNPLHTIGGLAEILTASDIGPRERRHAQTIMQEAAGLTRIVSDLLDIGRIDTGNVVAQVEAFALRSLADRSLGHIRSRAQAKALELTADVDDDVPLYVLGDAGRVGQILDNLLTNAVKFTTTGVVQLRIATGAGDNIVFSVADTGPGIAEESQTLIFEPFERVDHRAAGAGLGLAISSKLALLLDGEVRLESSDHRGSTFVLELPLVETTDAVEAPRSDAASDAGRTQRVLVVEDSAESQLLAAAQLDRLGYAHDMVDNGLDALTVAATAAYDVILMDWHLPGIDGLEATRRIRAREEAEGSSRTPIIAVTARAMAGDIQACLEAGADDFIAKPASLNDIAEALRKWAGVPGVDDSGDSVEEATVFADLLDELGDPELIVSLARTFLDELPDRIGRIEDADTSDLSAGQRSAHTLKSTSALVGASELSRIAGEVESVLHEGSQPSCGLMQRLQLAAAETQTTVKAVIARLEGAA